MKRANTWHSFWKGYRRGLKVLKGMCSLKRNYRKLQRTFKAIRKQ